MDKYDNLGVVGEGSYGMVIKCKHKETGQMVAIKKFLESDDDKIVQKIAQREIKMLRQLHHDNLVNLIESFRKRKRLYLVFEFVDHTILDQLEECPNGLDETTCKKILWQVLRGTEFCHSHNVIHRDIKPENILISKNGIIKICDFGFARTLAQPGEAYTDYVATRWYRAPELLVGDTKYGRAVDIWAIGCLLSEMLTGEPLFPGDSDIDQLYHIVRCFGNLPVRHKEVFLRNPLFIGMRLPEVKEVPPFEKKYPRVSEEAIDVMKLCLKLDPDKRPTCTELLKHDYFTKDGFSQRFAAELKQKIQSEHERSHVTRSIQKGKDSSNVNIVNASGEHIDTASKDVNENQKTNKVIAKKKKKAEVKEDIIINDDKVKKKNSNANNKQQVKHISLKPVSNTPQINASSHAVTLPPANNVTSIINSSHNISYEEQTGMDRDNRDRDKDHPASHTSIIPPIVNNAQPRPAIVKFKKDEKWSPRNPLVNGNRTSTFRSNEKFKKVGHYPKKSPTKIHHNTYSNSTSPQAIMVDKFATQEESQEKSKGKVQMTHEKSYDDRFGLSLPEVKGASDMTSKSKEKQQSPYKKSSVSSIPHISNNEPLTSSVSQLEVSTTIEKESSNPTLPNV